MPGTTVPEPATSSDNADGTTEAPSVVDATQLVPTQPEIKTEDDDDEDSTPGLLDSEEAAVDPGSESTTVVQPKMEPESEDETEDDDAAELEPVPVKSETPVETPVAETTIDLTGGDGIANRNCVVWVCVS